MPPPDAETVQVIPGSELIWKITPRPENSAKVWLEPMKGAQTNQGEIVAEHYKFYFILSWTVLCILHICYAIKWAGEEHRSNSSNRQSPQTWHPCTGEWRYWYVVWFRFQQNLKCFLSWWLSFYVHAHLFRFGKCREEKTGGKATHGPEKSLQINRGMENQASQPRTIMCYLCCIANVF